jgi:hypothetical protein
MAVDFDTSVIRYVEALGLARDFHLGVSSRPSGSPKHMVFAKTMQRSRHP